MRVRKAIVFIIAVVLVGVVDAVAETTPIFLQDSRDDFINPIGKAMRTELSSTFVMPQSSMTPQEDVW